MNITFRPYVKYLLAVLVFTSTGYFTTVSAAEESLKVVMRVEDQTITNFDLKKHFRIVSFLNRTPTNDDTFSRFEDQIKDLVIRKVLQENLLVQQNVRASDDDVEAYMDQIFEANSIPRDQFFAEAQRRGIAEHSLIDHYRHQLSWNRLILQNFGSEIRPDDAEINAKQADLISQTDSRRYIYREILLSGDKAKGSTNQVVALLNQGADPANIAQSFSDAVTAINGGIVGPLTDGELTSPVKNALNNLRPGRGFSIVPVINGTLIVQLLRVIEPQILGGYWAYTYLKTRRTDQTSKSLDDISQLVKTCRITLILEKRLNLDVERYESLPSGKIAESDRDSVLGMSVYEVRIIKTPEGGASFLLQLCSKERIYEGIFNREQVARQIYEYRLGQTANRLIEERRRSSFIHVLQ